VLLFQFAFKYSTFTTGEVSLHVILQILGSRGDMEAKIEEATRQKIDEINRNVQINKEKAMQRLLKLVCDIKPELHANFQAK